ncbi:MAG: hypothetical protein J0L92_18660 [Deltaproteobacteria bacterium]|nr:hypothetical protein [Deltaproteobacteria bacterium]
MSNVDRARWRSCWGSCVVSVVLALGEPTSAQAPPRGEVQTEPPPPPARPYSVPLLLRPLPAVNVVRFDTAIAPHDAYGPTDSGLELDVVQLVTVGVRATDWLMVLARMGWDWTSRPSTAGMSNLVLGATLTTRIEEVFRLSGFVAVGLPLGTDGGGAPNHRGARLGRLAMDNALFLTDHVSGIGGLGFAWIDMGWTLQAEATLLVFGRAEGTGDEAVVNSTFGVHVGYFLVPEVSVAGELHHQHFVSDPGALRTDPYGAELRSQTSGTLGVRFHASIGSVWIRPALAWSIGLDPPLAGDAWQVLQLDVPVFF